MNHIEQKDRSGCGIACVAMVTGRTYKEVREVFLKHYAHLSDLHWKTLPKDHQLTTGGMAGVTRQDLHRLLEHFGVKCVIVEDPDMPIIRSIRYDWGFHWVVIDAHGNKLDPAHQWGKGCTCQICGRKYGHDLLVPDDLWEKIKPEGKPKGAGLLCHRCILDRIEKVSDFGAWKLVPA